MQEISLVVIGTSAGGIEALKKILPSFKTPSSLSVVVVIHLKPDSRNLIPELFRDACEFTIKEADSNETICPETIYIAPPGYHLSIESSRSLSLSIDEPQHFSRPSIDVLFESAAHAYKKKVLAVLLTGANQDGAQGLKRIKAMGGTVVIQAPKSAESPTMPESGLALVKPDFMSDLNGIAKFFRELSTLRSNHD